MKIAFFSTKPHDRKYFDASLKKYGHEINYFETRFKTATTNLISDEEAICVFVNDVVDAEAIEQLKEKGVKLIVLRCAGFNNVDLPTAKKHGIPVVRVPAYSPYAVAEHAVALMLTLNRKTHKAYNRVREMDFSLKGLTGFDVYGKTVGVIGTGKIGRCYARIMRGFGCKVICSDPYPSESLMQEGFKYMALEDILPQADILALHCPLIPETKHLINKSTIRQMKTGVMLINTSRGALVDTKAVIKGLKKGKIGALGIDVYEQEEQLFFEDLSDEIIMDDVITRLMAFPNVLITSHQAFFTHEALEQIAGVTLSNISAFEQNEELINEVVLGN